MAGWIVDEAADSSFAFWPPPLSTPGPKAARNEPSGLALARELAQSDDRTARWIGKDAVRELESEKVRQRFDQ